MNGNTITWRFPTCPSRSTHHCSPPFPSHRALGMSSSMGSLPSGFWLVSIHERKLQDKGRVKVLIFPHPSLRANPRLAVLPQLPSGAATQSRGHPSPCPYKPRDGNIFSIPFVSPANKATPCGFPLPLPSSL